MCKKLDFPSPFSPNRTSKSSVSPVPLGQSRSVQGLDPKENGGVANEEVGCKGLQVENFTENRTGRRGRDPNEYSGSGHLDGKGVV